MSQSSSSSRSRRTRETDGLHDHDDDGGDASSHSLESNRAHRKKRQKCESDGDDDDDAADSDMKDHDMKENDHDHGGAAAASGADDHLSIVERRSAFTAKLLEMMFDCYAIYGQHGPTLSAREKRIDQVKRIVAMIEEDSKRPSNSHSSTSIRSCHYALRLSSHDMT